VRVACNESRDLDAWAEAAPDPPCEGPQGQRRSRQTAHALRPHDACISAVRLAALERHRFSARPSIVARSMPPGTLSTTPAVELKTLAR